MRNRYLYLLDILRGLASLWVVTYHYQHFYFIRAVGLPADFQIAALPFYSVLWPIYQRGDWALDAFFAISGFVFYYLYSEPIHDRSVSWRAFWWLRFSRLYPLHFVMLAYVA